MSRKKRIYSLDKLAATPQIGIFWIINNQIVQFSEPVNNVAPISGFKDSNYNHDAYWARVQEMYPQFLQKEYFDIARGRVLYVVNTGVYKIILPTIESQNQGIISEVINAFSLPKMKTSVEIDHHYDKINEADWEEN